MKIHAEIITDGSSRNFALTVAIKDKAGRTYAFTDNPFTYRPDYGGEADFVGDLPGILLDNRLRALPQEAKYALEKPNDAEQAERCADMQVGDEVSLAKVPGKTKIAWHTWLDYAIEVRGAEGGLGLLPAEAVRILGDMLDNAGLNITATVCGKRRKLTQKAALTVAIKVEPQPDCQNPLVFGSLAELCRFLTANVVDDCDLKNDESDHQRRLQEETNIFTQEVMANIADISDIAQISLCREYTAWGQSLDQIAEGDKQLCELAQKALNSQGEAQQQALAAMQTYIITPNAKREGNYFGEGYTDIRYKWQGDAEGLLALAKRLDSGYLLEHGKGWEVEELDLATGQYTAYAEFELK